MNAIRTAAAATALSLATVFALPAQAMPASNLTHLGAPTAAEKSAFLVGESLFPGRPSRLDRIDAQASSAAMESYFDFDAVITLGALVLGGVVIGGMGIAAAGRKAPAKVASAEDRDPSWRESVFQALQADLAEFTDGYRRAA
jgi:hypothetical protein